MLLLPHSETQAFLDTLIDCVVSARLLLILTYRPEYQHRCHSDLCAAGKNCGLCDRATSADDLRAQSNGP